MMNRNAKRIATVAQSCWSALVFLANIAGLLSFMAMGVVACHFLASQYVPVMPPLLPAALDPEASQTASLFSALMFSAPAWLGFKLFNLAFSGHRALRRGPSIRSASVSASSTAAMTGRAAIRP